IPATKAAPRGPFAAIARTSSSLPWNATFSRLKAAETWSSIPLSDVGMDSLRLSGLCEIQRCQNLGGSERDRTQPRARRVEYRIRDRRGHNRCRGFTSTPGDFVGSIDQIDDDIGHIGKG